MARGEADGLQPVTAEEPRFVCWWYRLLCVGSLSLFSIILAVQSISAWPKPVAIAFSVATLLPLSWMVIRTTRTASVELRASHLIIRGLLRTRSIPWSDIEGADVGRGSTALLTWRVPVVLLHGSGTIFIDEVRSRRSNTIVDDVVRSITSRLGDR